MRSYVRENRNVISVEIGFLLFVVNSVTLATQVRCDILKAIATKLSKPDVLEMYVTPFISRPVIHIKEKTGNNAPYALTFADANKPPLLH